MAVGDFPVDANVRRIGKHGRPPDGHPRRCQAKKNRTQVQCAQWAKKGEFYCKFHLRGAGKGGRNRGRMKNFYRKIQGKKLSEWMKLAEIADGDRKSLAGEVDVARALCAETVGMVSTVLDADQDKITEAQRLTVMSLAKDSLEHVSRLVERMVKVEAISSATMDADQVQGLLQRVLHVLAKELRDRNVPEAEEIHRAITESVEDLFVDDKAPNPSKRVHINIT